MATVTSAGLTSTLLLWASQPLVAAGLLSMAWMSATLHTFAHAVSLPQQSRNIVLTVWSALHAPMQALGLPCSSQERELLPPAPCGSR